MEHLKIRKMPFIFCENTCSIFTVISCKNQRCGWSGRGEVWHCHFSAVAAWSERKGDFRGAERSFEMFALREGGHLLAEGKCQGFLPAHGCLGKRWETILSGLPEPSSFGALGSQSQTLNTKIRGQRLLASLAFLMPGISGVQLWRDCTGKGKVKSQEVWVILTPWVTKPRTALSGISRAAGYGDF